MRKLVVVISLIVVVAAVATAQYRNSAAHAREAVLKGDRYKVRDAIDRSDADRNKYPVSTPAGSGPGRK